MAFFGKTFNLEKEEKFEEFVDTLAGGSEEKKQFLLKHRPNQKFEKNGDEYTLVMLFGDKEKSLPFKSGVPFQEELKTVKLSHVLTVEGNTIKHEIKMEDESVVITVVKEFTDDKLVETITNNNANVEAKRYYSA